MLCATKIATFSGRLTSIIFKITSFLVKYSKVETALFLTAASLPNAIPGFAKYNLIVILYLDLALTRSISI